MKLYYNNNYLFSFDSIRTTQTSDFVMEVNIAGEEFHIGFSWNNEIGRYSFRITGPRGHVVKRYIYLGESYTAPGMCNRDLERDAVITFSSQSPIEESEELTPSTLAKGGFRMVILTGRFA